MSAGPSAFYKVGGGLPQDVPSYVTRTTDRDLYEALRAGEFCYVLNSRQMGKTSLMVRTLAKLQANGWAGIIIDFSAKDSQVDKPDRWYDGIINQLNRQFGLLERSAFRSWLKERDFIAPVERLAEFIETVLLPSRESPIVIFIDEIDSTLGLPFTDDFFALIRACYNKRAENLDYRRLTFALLGVAAPSELIGDAKRTPFNIGESIDLKGFEFEEALPLAAGLASMAEQPEEVLREILHWTGGQPFLTQRLCQLVVDSDAEISAGNESTQVQQLVESRLIENWESQDHQEHLKTIRKRLLDDEQQAGYLLELYRSIRQAEELAADNQPEERELQLSGLVVKRDNQLRVYNPIYAAVFNEAWINTELQKLRPYSESFRAWVASDKADSSRLLRGGALAEAERWAGEKATLSGEDREFLAASRARQREEDIVAKEREAELAREKQAREAAEAAEQIQSEANQQAKRKIRRGGLVLGLALGVATLLGGFALVSGARLKVANEQLEESQTLVAEAEQELQEVQQERETAQKELLEARRSAQKATDELERFEKELQSLEIQRHEADEKLRQAEQGQQTAQASLASLRQNLESANADIERIEKEKLEAQKLTEDAKVALENAEERLVAVNEEQKEIEELNKTVNTLSDLIDDLYASDRPDVARDVIEQIGLSFTDYDRSEFRKALLNSSIVLASLYLDSRDPEGMSRAMETSIGTIQENQGLFSESPAAQSIAFFAYAVQGNFLEETNPNLFPKESYERAFRTAGYRFNLEEEELAESYRSLLDNTSGSRRNDSLLTLAKASLKRHYTFRFKKINQEIEILLSEHRWKEADVLTWYALYSSASSKDVDRFEYENISCSDIDTVDALWLKYSQVGGESRFGFKVQGELHTGIQQRIGGANPASLNILMNELDWFFIGDDISKLYENASPLGNNVSYENLIFRFPNPETDKFKEYEDLNWNADYYLDASSKGHLPALAVNEFFRSWLYDLPMSYYGNEVVVTEHCGYIFLAARTLGTGAGRGSRW